MKLINIHSLVDVITNSSTVIYTYQNGSIDSAKELLSELLKMMEVEGNVDDMFFIDSFCDEYQYLEYEDAPDEIHNMSSDEFKEYISKILKREIEKPEWMVEVEQSETWSGYSPNNFLHIETKDEKYQPIVDKMLNFLNSPHHEATRDG